MNPFKMNDVKLIELVKQNKHLYDKSHFEYHDMPKKAITWKAIGVALGTSGEHCRKRFRNLRDRFAKQKKDQQKNEMLSNPKLPVIFKKMMFLWDHLLHRNELNYYPEVEEEVTPDIREEVYKQIQMLKECEETNQANCSDENNVCDLQEEIVFIYDKTNNANQENNVETEMNVEMDSPVNNSNEQLDKVCDIQTEVANTSDKVGKNSKTKTVLKTNSAHGQKIKRRKITAESCNQTSETQISLLLPKDNNLKSKSSNELFCAMAKQYLDEINSREKLSKTRLQIMTILHNELYSNNK